MAKISDYTSSPAGIFDSPLECGFDRLAGGLQIVLFTFIGMILLTVLASLASVFISLLPAWLIVPTIIKNLFLLIGLAAIVWIFIILVIELISGLFADGEEGEKNCSDFMNTSIEVGIAEWILKNDD